MEQDSLQLKDHLMLAIHRFNRFFPFEKQALRLLLLFVAALCCGNTTMAEQAVVTGNLAVGLEINGPIGPATADYFHAGLNKARDKNARIVVLQMDTPGGLDTAMRAIIKDILSSPIPVVTYVAPSGARAASAGTYILYASHIAAMAPGTNLGAATPVNVMGSNNPLPDLKNKYRKDKDEAQKPPGDDSLKNTKDVPDTARQYEAAPQDAMAHKVINDATAYLRSLAKLRGRNEEWAVQAIQSADSLPSEEALAMNVIDLIAVDEIDLLKQINGRTVQLNNKPLVLDTLALSRENIAPDWRNKFLAVITNPTIAYVLVLIGLYGLFFEFSNPGAIVPGVTGGIALILALYAFQMLPVNYAGLALMLLGMILVVSEALVPSFGALGMGGIVAFTVGSIILMDTDIPGYGVPLALIAAISATTTAVFLMLVVMLFKARKQPVISGQEELLNARGKALVDFDRQGVVMIHGERWSARSHSAVKQGDEVIVNAIEGLTLLVTPLATTTNNTDKGE